jgi:hypothetical protein
MVEHDQIRRLGVEVAAFLLVEQKAAKGWLTRTLLRPIVASGAPDRDPEVGQASPRRQWLEPRL